MFAVYIIFVFMFFLFCMLGCYYLDSNGERYRAKETKQSEKQDDECRFTEKKVEGNIVKTMKSIGDLFLIPMLALARHQFFPPKENHDDKHWESKFKTRMVVGGIIIYMMAIGNVLLSIPIALLGLTMLYILIQAMFSIALIRGFNLARIFFGLGAIGKGSLFLIMAIDYALMPRNTSIAPYDWIIGVFGLVGGLLLLFSKSARYFTYYKRQRINLAGGDK